jgi:hypothetical protein
MWNILTKDGLPIYTLRLRLNDEIVIWNAETAEVSSIKLSVLDNPARKKREKQGET